MAGTDAEPTVDAAKAALRQRVLAARAALSPAQRAEASARIGQHLRGLAALAAARAVLGYAAFGAEADLDDYLASRVAEGAGVFLPWVDGEQLRIARVVDLDADLAPGWGGVREPRGAGRRPARADRLHAAVVPGVAFDERGHRLGYGGGHFDRLLAELAPDALVVGVGFACQVVDAVPVQAHDRPVDVVVTELGVHDTRPDR